MRFTDLPRFIAFFCLGAILFELSVMAFLRFSDLQEQAQASQPSRQPQILTVDPDAILKLFVEQRGLGLEGDAFTLAVRKLDSIVAREASRVHAEFGVLVVKADLVLAGGTDYTMPFLERVLQTWDATP